jgi:hypothetical protein
MVYTDLFREFLDLLHPGAGQSRRLGVDEESVRRVGIVRGESHREFLCITESEPNNFILDLFPF